MSNKETSIRIQGASAFGIDVRLDDNGDEVVYDAHYEPSEGVLERIAEHKDAIGALLKARKTAASIKWDKLNDLSEEAYGALVESIKEDIRALVASLDQLERAGAAILPTMHEAACSWGEAVQTLLSKPYNLRFERRRPKLVSDAEWVSALYSARLLGYNCPQPPKGRIP